MSKSLHQLNLNEFAALVRGLNWQRRITGILVQQPHLPDSPYIGLASMEKMWEDDVGVKQWSDLAQHITIAPDGSIWTGRGWNIPPARMGGWDSQPAEEVPFLVRIIGNYSNERDPFGGVARETLIAVAATLLDQFKLKVTSLRMDEADALVDSTALHKAVTAYRSKARSKQTKGNGQALLKAQQRKVDQLLPVLAEVSDDWKTEGTFPVEDGQGVDNRGILDKKWSVSEKEKLSRHVINLRAGKFTPSGDFTTTAEDVTRLFGQHVAVALAAAKAQGRKFRVLFWAHGGLVKEKDALQYALNHIDGWISAGIYPIYFIWETNALTALKDLLRGQRSMDDRGLFDLIGNANDAMWEQTLHVPGMALWGKMKEYAANGVQPDGGALFTAKKLAAFAKSSGPGVEFYACGHSAGSIFHAHFLPSVGQQGGPVFKDLFLLAPAITVADFRTHLERQIGPGKTIEHTTLFTMNSIAELAHMHG